METPLIRLNKYLSEQGLASRRKADELIARGLIRVNGKTVTELGTKIDPLRDRVEMDDTVVDEQKKLVYIVLNKSAGYVTSSSPTTTEPKIVLNLVKTKERVFPIGRLDKDTTGLLILTNDGVLAYHLTHPKFECEKEYEVTLNAPLTPERIRKIEAGVRLERLETKPTRVLAHPTDIKRARIIITEGKNRQVRKVFGKVGCEVITLRRIRVRGFHLPDDLAIGKWRHLTADEVKLLREPAGEVT